MAEVVLGIGTSHSPLLTFDAAMWIVRAADDLRNDALTLSDGRTLTYAQLLAERGPKFEQQASLPSLEAQAARAEGALDRLADAIEEAAPDVVLIIGDDQDELYSPGNTPSIAIYCGAEVVMRPLGEIMTDPPEWMRRAVGGYAMDVEHRFAGAPEFALQLVDGLMDLGVDLAVHSKVHDSRIAAFGHAYGFVAHRLLKRRPLPIVPILLNTYYPPNIIRPARCFEIGDLIGRTIAALPGDQRVAIVASGGLSHFVTDPELDQAVLNAMRSDGGRALRSLPMSALREGSSEILCWVMAGGALMSLEYCWSDYFPVYRTPAGTGIGLAFAVWQGRRNSKPAGMLADSALR